MDKKYKISKNKKYDFFQITPTPSNEEITKFYSDEFYTGDFKKFNDSSLEVQLEDKDFYEENWENIYQNLTKFLNTKNPPTMKDIKLKNNKLILEKYNNDIILF